MGVSALLSSVEPMSCGCSITQKVSLHLQGFCSVSHGSGRQPDGQRSQGRGPARDSLHLQVIYRRPHTCTKSNTWILVEQRVCWLPAFPSTKQLVSINECPCPVRLRVQRHELSGETRFRSLDKQFSRTVTLLHIPHTLQQYTFSGPGSLIPHWTSWLTLHTQIEFIKQFFLKEHCSSLFNPLRLMKNGSTNISTLRGSLKKDTEQKFAASTTLPMTSLFELTLNMHTKGRAPGTKMSVQRSKENWTQAVSEKLCI